MWPVAPPSPQAQVSRLGNNGFRSEEQQESSGWQNESNHCVPKWERCSAASFRSGRLTFGYFFCDGALDPGSGTTRQPQA